MRPEVADCRASVRIMGVGVFEFRPCAKGERLTGALPEGVLREIEKTCAYLEACGRAYVDDRSCGLGGSSHV